ncbi:MAG: hypothetical protein QMC95_17355, partial [Desulfitobacteriaceae bacterium]|nr:hypothetical protein [Desulfitobacteriaceae bacterium]
LISHIEILYIFSISISKKNKKPFTQLYQSMARQRRGADLPTCSYSQPLHDLIAAQNNFMP